MARRSDRREPRQAGAPDARAISAGVLVQVLEHGRSLGDVLSPAQAAVDDPRLASLVQELCFGTLRWYYRLDAVLQQLLDKPLRSRDADIRCLLLIGLYQMELPGLPRHAAVNETVQATRALDKGWASGLVNAVLRRFQRQHGALLEVACTCPAALHVHPDWLIRRLRSDWPDDWAMILLANNSRPPFTLRVNRRRLTRNEYLDLLSEHSLPAHAVSHVTQGVWLERPVPVGRLPGFASGDVSVQDAAAQLAAGLLQLAPGQRVLDACAAPGGKTAHILETEPDVQLLAMDIDAGRLQRTADNLARLSLHAELIAGDAREPQGWWDGRMFDRIMLDVPCSGSGVIRRHPDIKVLRRPGDIDALVSRQAAILDAIWPLLSPGGMLLYCTCSVIQAENSDQVGDFLARHADAVEAGISAAWGRGCTHGRQIFPGESLMDGFYFACVRKNS